MDPFVLAPSEDNCGAELAVPHITESKVFPSAEVKSDGPVCFGPHRKIIVVYTEAELA